MHRFNKAQQVKVLLNIKSIQSNDHDQDIFLPYLEQGLIQVSFCFKHYELGSEFDVVDRCHNREPIIQVDERTAQSMSVSKKFIRVGHHLTGLAVCSFWRSLPTMT